MLWSMTSRSRPGILWQTLSLLYKGVRGQIAGWALFSFLTGYFFKVHLDHQAAGYSKLLVLSLVVV